MARLLAVAALSILAVFHLPQAEMHPKNDPPVIKCSISFSSWDPTYSVQCSSSSIEGKYYPVKTVCTFTCGDKYYKHAGDTSRTCQADKQWSGSAIDCQPIKCPKVPIQNPDSNKVESVDPAKDCFKNELSVGDTCQFKCPSGYEFKGDSILLCQKDGNKATGTWKVDLAANPPTCTVSPCDNPKPPANVGVITHGIILVPVCKSGYYPVSAWPLNSNFFICNGKQWINPVTQATLSSLPKCTAKSPPAGQARDVPPA